jgi:hypothetical protein
MITHPSADELLLAVSGFIEQVAPDLKDRDVFLARVAVNALATVRRELQAGQAAEAAATTRLAALLHRSGSFTELNDALGEAIRAGDFDDSDGDLLAHLKASIIDRMQIDQPGYSGLKAALKAEP